MLSRVSVLLTLCTIPLLLTAQNTFYTPEGFACVGDKIVLKCYVESPTLENFDVKAPLISFDDSEPYTMDQINGNTVPNIDTSRYHIEQLTTGYSRIGASITINTYEASDSDILFGCYGRYKDGDNTTELTSGYPPPTAGPPAQILTVYSKVESISYYCYADVEVYFLAPYSDSPIQHYKMFVNGEFYKNLDKQTSYLNPTTVSFSVTPASTYKISVAAVSCAGTAPSSGTEGTISIPSYELDSSTFFIELNYFNYLFLSWNFKEKDGIPIAIGYKLKIDTSFTIDDLNENFILNQSLPFTQDSDKTTYTHDLGLSIISQHETSLDIIAKLEIVSQCYDSDYPSNSLTVENSDAKSNVSPINLANIPANLFWIIVIALAIALAICSLGSICGMLCTWNEWSRRRTVMRRQGYVNFVQSNTHEQMEPLMDREEPGYSVNTADPPKY